MSETITPAEPVGIKDSLQNIVSVAIESIGLEPTPMLTFVFACLIVAVVAFIVRMISKLLMWGAIILLAVGMGTMYVTGDDIDFEAIGKKLISAKEQAKEQGMDMAKASALKKLEEAQQ